MAQVVLVSVGGAVVFDHFEARSHCQTASAQVLARLDGLLGLPTPAKEFNPDPSVPTGVRLVRAQQIEGGLDGMTYVAAYAQVPGRPDVGPGVWRALVPGGLLPVPDITLSSQNNAARSMTPTLSYDLSGRVGVKAQQALDCVNG